MQARIRIPKQPICPFVFDFRTSVNACMQCRFCKFSSVDQQVLLKHCRLRHGGGANWPCIHIDCVCTFKTPGALKSHLYRSHSKTVKRQENSTFQCELCEFKDICSESKFFTHIGHHLRNRETVCCPFLRCVFKTNKLSSFSCHRSRNHKTHTLKDFRTSITTDTEDESNDIGQPLEDDLEAGTSSQSCLRQESVEEGSAESVEDVNVETLEHKLASLFLCMQTVLHVSKSATQKIVEEFNAILYFSKFHTLQNIREILTKHNIEIDDSVVQEITDAIFQTNPLLVTTSDKGTLSTDYRRNTYFKEHFSVIEPTEYLYDRTHKNVFVYVSITQVLESLLGCAEFLDKAVFNQESLPGTYKSFQDGQYFKDNQLLGEQDIGITLGLYIDDFEVCNPLGTSRKIHKITAVYWVVLNLPAKYRSSLHSIQLAVFGKSADVHQFGYEKFLDPLIKDIKSLEQEGVFVEVLERYVKGTVFCVCADNLGAHGLAGFQESFNVEKFCRFCLISRKEIDTREASDFRLRTVEQHNVFVEELKDSDTLTNVNGVKRECVLSKHLSYFHPITGFPPDILHDLFEGIIPVELSLCLKELISKRVITFDELNNRIKSFPYKHSDRVNKPQKIPKTSFAKGTIGGNGHENWALLRLLPLIIGSSVPEQEPSWVILMDLKEIAEIIVSTQFSEETLCYLDSKISDHRKLLIDTFPDLKLRPKHHFVQHYPHLIRCFGPLVELWTMRFESKHSFFKKIVHDTHNFKNVLLTLSTKHQQMMAYHLDGHSLFKSKLYVESVKVVKISSLEETLRAVIKRKYPDQETVSLSKDVRLHGTQYVEGMIISAGQCSGLPDFYKILYIVVNANEVSFVSKHLSSWYLEHYRSYELVESSYSNIDVLDPEALNDYHPLTAYTVGGKVLVTLKTSLLR